MARAISTCKYESEAALCADFIAAVRADRKWECYPETQGWDILLSRKSDGVQIGVEAKLRLNTKVVCQALPEFYYSVGEVGPDYRAVLVPDNSTQNDLVPICRALGITVLTYDLDWKKHHSVSSFHPRLPDEGRGYDLNSWHEWAPLKRHPLPDYVPDVAAGASAPVALTTWKIAAIKLAIILESRPVTRADFKVLGLSPSRWTDPYTGWLTRTDDGYVAGKNIPDFKAQHPTNFEQIKADAAKWMPHRAAGVQLVLKEAS